MAETEATTSSDQQHFRRRPILDLHLFVEHLRRGVQVTDNHYPNTVANGRVMLESGDVPLPHSHQRYHLGPGK